MMKENTYFDRKFPSLMRVLDEFGAFIERSMGASYDLTTLADKVKGDSRKHTFEFHPKAASYNNSWYDISDIEALKHMPVCHLRDLARTVKGTITKKALIGDFYYVARPDGKLELTITKELVREFSAEDAIQRAINAFYSE